MSRKAQPRPIVLASVTPRQLDLLTYVGVKTRTDANGAASTLLAGVLNVLEHEIGAAMLQPHSEGDPSI